MLRNQPTKKTTSKLAPRKTIKKPERGSYSLGKANKNPNTVPFKSNMVINDALINFLGKHEIKRAPDRVILIPDQKETNKWLAYHPDNPKNKFSPVGDYAYVTKLNEENSEHPEKKKIVAWPINGHHTTFHVGLSKFDKEIAYGGEVHFKKNGSLIFYDSASGTYKPKPENKEQAGFPIEKYRKPDFSF